MPVGLVPTATLLAGALCGTLSAVDAKGPLFLVALAVVAGWTCYASAAFVRPLLSGVLAAVGAAASAAGFFCAGIALGADARVIALASPLRAVLNREVGGFLIDGLGPAARHDPLRIRATLLEDASISGDVTSLRVHVSAVRLRGRWQEAAGGVTLAVGGAIAAERAGQWRAGREVETPVTFRRPARYLNDGVPDFERDLALDGTTLFGSMKSGLLVDVRSNGTLVEEIAARVRIHVRRSLDRWVRLHDPLSSAIVAAVVIGDRTGLPEDVRLRLQAAGTYHVIAISGGNIAILAGLALVFLRVCGLAGRPAAIATIVLLAAYAQVVTAGASVWRATLMATLYLAARAADHRSPPWHAIAVAAALVVCARPLDVRDVGFVLTFGATAALLESSRAARLVTQRPLPGWLIGSLAASLAVEVALLPVSAWTFSRVTSAGLLLNLLAVPLMGVVQISGMVVAGFDEVAALARPAGWVAHLAASALVESAAVVDVAPWLSARVPPPPLALALVYYAALGGALAGRGVVRIAGLGVVAVCGFAIASGTSMFAGSTAAPRAPLRLTVFDVGQGDAALLELPNGSSMLVDSGGAPSGGTFDIGGRVLAPALWARGVRSLAALLITHGDPDHIGGARAVVADFEPVRLWEGVPVPGHTRLVEVLEEARSLGVSIEQRRTGEALREGSVAIRVLHPPPPDWERQRVRNDDSVVIEVTYGDVAMLLTGDIGADVERQILPHLTPARVRILKVAHHGSRTSTSGELVDAWRPQVALISCGRGNTFGHPAAEVLRRLDTVGAQVYRTDRDGQVTIDTDGAEIEVQTYMGRRP